MGTVITLRGDFERAKRHVFIVKCLDLIEKSTNLYASTPGIYKSERDLLELDMPPIEKLNQLVFRVPHAYRTETPERAERYRNLEAGVVVHERLRQVRDWLAVYDSLGDKITKEDVAEFPPLNVRRAVMPLVYDRACADKGSLCIVYAMQTSDRAFMMTKDRTRHLQHVLG